MYVMDTYQWSRESIRQRIDLILTEYFGLSAGKNNWLLGYRVAVDRLN